MRIKRPAIAITGLAMCAATAISFAQTKKSGSITASLTEADRAGVVRNQSAPSAPIRPEAPPDIEVEVRPARIAPNLPQAEIVAEDLPLGLAFRMLADQAGINYIEPQIPEGETVSYQFFDQRPLDVFVQVAETRGFRVVTSNGMTTLTRPDIGVPMYTTVERYVLRHTDPTWVLPSIANLLGIKLNQAGETIPTIPQGTSQAGQISSIEGEQGSSFVSGGQDSVQSTVPETSRWTPGIPWDTPLNTGEAADGSQRGDPTQQTAIFIDRKANAIVVRATPDLQDMVAKYIKQTDVPEPQLIIETRIVEIETGNQLDQGIDWSQTFGEGVTFAVRTSDELLSDPVQLLGGATQFFWAPAVAVLEWPDVQATFRNFAAKRNAATLNMPTVLTKSGVPVSIRSTIEESIELFSPQNTVNTGGTVVNDNFLQTDIRTFVTGVTLDVVPRLLDDGYVDLNVNPSVSSRIGETLGATGQALPVISRRTATTTATVRSGQTLVIGGLIRVERTDDRTGVPPLDKIPLLGHLVFGDKDKGLRRTNLLIFCTPRILYPGQRSTVFIPEKDNEMIEDLRGTENIFAPGADPVTSDPLKIKNER